LYQISHPKELSNIGIQEYLDTNNGVSIIEWPEKMISFLPDPDLEIILNHSENNEEERTLEIKSKDSIDL
jgi:tRNA threonylcarbamoyladenosine biosynthesis protein TsaE